MKSRELDAFEKATLAEARDLVQMKKVTIKEMADMCKLNDSTLGRYLRGNVVPPAERVALIREACTKIETNQSTRKTKPEDNADHKPVTNKKTPAKKNAVPKKRKVATVNPEFEAAFDEKPVLEPPTVEIEKDINVEMQEAIEKAVKPLREEQNRIAKIISELSETLHGQSKDISNMLQEIGNNREQIRNYISNMDHRTFLDRLTGRR